jgi:transposase
MATREQFKLSREERQRRHFSENFKKQKVREIEQKRVRITDICKQYEVSQSAVWKWVNKYGSLEKNKSDRMIIENQSDTIQLLALKKQVAELERIIGQKQVLLDFKDKMIEIAEETYGIDIKKKCSIEPLNITGVIENNSK